MQGLPAKREQSQRNFARYYSAADKNGNGHSLEPDMCIGRNLLALALAVFDSDSQVFFKTGPATDRCRMMFVID